MDIPVFIQSGTEKEPFDAEDLPTTNTNASWWEFISQFNQKQWASLDTEVRLVLEFNARHLVREQANYGLGDK